MTAKAIKSRLNKLYHTSIQNAAVEASPELRQKHKMKAQNALEELKRMGMEIEPMPTPMQRPSSSMPDGEYEPDDDDDYEEEDDE
jgi:TRAP-type C4-dicarboxylate transport system substrate-binding protein